MEVKPPSTRRLNPFTYDEESEHKNNIGPEYSSSFDILLAGVFLEKF